MLRFKCCPRCINGDVHVNKDMFGWYVECLQCGHMKNVDSASHADDLLKRLTDKTNGLPDKRELLVG